MQKQNHILKVKRLSQHLEAYYEIKDPSIVKTKDSKFLIFASIGNSITQTWIVGRFIADDVLGEWQEIEPVTFHNLTGPQLCAPAVTFSQINGQDDWTMYIQTACFEADGIIALAKSTDGINFYGQASPLVTKQNIVDSPNPVIGVYDAGISEIKTQGEEILCLLYSGYRKIGCGDLYLSTKKKNEEQWSSGTCILSQEDIPFHNRPDYEYFEWGLEGAKLVQLADDCYLMIGVCFLPLPNGFAGTRQRVFFAVANNPQGPFKPIGTPLAPQKNCWGAGENGHPDAIIIGDQIAIIYQERFGNNQPWHLRTSLIQLAWLTDFLRNRLKEIKVKESTTTNEAAQYYFLTQTQSPTFDHTA